MVKVFLSYRHESDAKHPDHSKKVRELGVALRTFGFEVVLDQFYDEINPGGPDEQWPAWCEAQVEEADKVVMVASDGYFRCYDQKEKPGKGLGAACETTVIRNSLYKTSYKTDKFRIACFDKLHRENIPTALSGMHAFNVESANGVEQLSRWIRGVSTVPTSSGLIAWPPADPSHEPDLANRGDEFKFFTELISRSTGDQAMLLRAESNQGKTTLLMEFMKYARKVLGLNSYAIVDFKGEPSKEFTLDTLRVKLGPLLPHFQNAGSTLWI